jgi:hypothetical protein
VAVRASDVALGNFLEHPVPRIVFFRNIEQFGLRITMIKFERLRMSSISTIDTPLFQFQGIYFGYPVKPSTAGFIAVHLKTFRIVFPPLIAALTGTFTTRSSFYIPFHRVPVYTRLASEIVPEAAFHSLPAGNKFHLVTKYLTIEKSRSTCSRHPFFIVNGMTSVQAYPRVNLYAISST